MILLEVTRRTLEAGRGGIDVLWMGEDLGNATRSADQSEAVPKAYQALARAIRGTGA